MQAYRMKVCTKCGVEKPLEAFQLKTGGRYRSGQCRDCKSIYDKSRRSGFDPATRERIRKKNLLHKEKVRQKLREFLVGKGCVDCGEDDPVVLEFDHVEPSSKSYSIAALVQSGYNWEEKVLPEIAKCVLRCQNCHRRKTAREQGWFDNKRKLYSQSISEWADE